MKFLSRRWEEKMDSSLATHLIVAALCLTAMVFLVLFELNSRRNEAVRSKGKSREELADPRDGEKRKAA
jgi:hypothetical protein